MTETKRPSGVTFSAVMMFIVAGFELVSAIMELTQSSWLGELGDGGLSNFLGNYSIWAGIFDLILALVFFYAGYSILKGGVFGYFWTLVFAVLASIRWFVNIPWAPILSLLVIGINILIIHGLSSNIDYFD